MNCVPLPVLRGQGRYMSKEKKTEAKHGFQAVTSIIRKRGLSWIERLESGTYQREAL